MSKVNNSVIFYVVYQMNHIIYIENLKMPTILLWDIILSMSK